MYWERTVLKSRAKNVLRYSYWTIFLALLLFYIASNMFGISNLFDIRISYSSGISGIELITPFTKLVEAYPKFYNLFVSIYPTILFITVILTVISLGVTIFVINPLSVGLKRYLYYNSKSKAKFSTIFTVFSPKYIKTVVVMLTMNLIIIVGYILLIVPGIFLSYALRMVPYIIAENPNIPLGRALELSYNMTNGQKLDMFVLDLSFLGWMLLGVLCFGIGVFFVIPYVQATDAELYGALRLRAAKENLCTPNEIAAEYFV